MNNEKELNEQLIEFVNKLNSQIEEFERQTGGVFTLYQSDNNDLKICGLSYGFIINNRLINSEM